MDPNNNAPLKPGSEYYEAGSDLVALADGWDNTRAGWRLEYIPNSYGDFVITGYGGENQIAVHQMSMQDGRQDMVVVASCVDNPITVVQKTVNWLEDDTLTALNEMLYPLMKDPLEDED